MKNLLIFSLLALSGYLGAMNPEKDITVLYHRNFDQSFLPSLLWEQINAKIVDIAEKSGESLSEIIIESGKTYIYGIITPEQLETAFSKLDSPKDSVSLMIKDGDSMHQKFVETYDLEVKAVNFNETSFLDPTWRKIHGSEPPKGLQYLDEGQTVKPDREALAVREYYCTNAGSQFEQKKKIFWLIVDAPQDALSGIIELGSAYLAKVESLDRETVRNTQLININNSNIIVANASFGWDRVKNILLEKDIGDGKKADFVIFFKFSNLRYHYGLRSKNSKVDIIKIARDFNGNGWIKDGYSEAGFNSKTDILALIEFLQSNAVKFGL